MLRGVHIEESLQVIKIIHSNTNTEHPGNYRKGKERANDTVPAKRAMFFRDTGEKNG